jgi:hypothetical protein
MESKKPTPENLTPPKASIKDAYEVRDVVDKLFEAKRHDAEVEPYSVRSDLLTETITTSPYDGKYFRLSRQRLNYEDSLTEIDYESPQTINIDGKNMYHTPVTINVMDEATGKETKTIILETTHDSYVDNPSVHGRVYIDRDDPSQLTWDDVMLPRTEVKELIAQLSWAEKR